jgi:sulfate adenylyltransferase large subunit
LVLVSVRTEDRVDLCRLVTCGSVDDGKSTLIGRLLFDAKQVMADQLEHIEEVSERRGDGYVNLALLTDGLRAEREQGITIDVAYRPFATPRRRFIIADSPGHVQYTRNMATGASTADVAVILVDARHGVVEQTRRHTYVCALLRIPRVVVAVNKMDLVDFDEDVFDDIETHFRDFARDLDLEIDLIPISALDGDNVVDDSERMPWYEGTSLLHHLERIPLDRDDIALPARYPVQWVVRPQAVDHHDYRGYAGQIAAGDFRPGMDVVVLPGGQRTTVASVETLNGPLEIAEAPQSVTIRLAENLDVARGDMIVAADSELPVVAREIVADVCWMSDRPLTPGSRYVIRHTTREAIALVDAIVHRIDIHTFGTGPAEAVGLNDIARIRLRTSQPLVVDPYAGNRATGSFILIDEATNDTLAAGMIVAATPLG